MFLVDTTNHLEKDMKQIDETLTFAQLVEQMGYSLDGLSRDQLDAVECAAQSASLEWDRGQSCADSEYDAVSSYVAGCFENNFNQ